MYVKLIAHTPEPERVIAAAARCCYSNKEPDKLFDDISEEESAAFVEKLMALGHQSAIEHVSFTFVVSGISRNCLAQLTRHRIASYSVRSFRYNEFKGKCITPDKLKENDNAHSIFKGAVRDTEWAYEELLKEGMPKEDARAVLPGSASTSLVMTMNARAMLHFFSLRCCTRAQSEIRELANEMARIVKEVAPSLFAKAGPSCVQLGYCPEERMSCGRAPTLSQLLRREEENNEDNH